MRIEIDPPVERGPASAAEAERDPQILIVDDSSLIRKILTGLLRQAGYTAVTHADSGASAFAALGMAGGEPVAAFDLILMDMMLPDTDGITIIRALADRPETRDIPIIMITGEQNDTILSEAFEAGVMDFLNKPVLAISLWARVGSALRLKRETDRRIARERELDAALAELERLSLTDALTGVANRRHFDQRLRDEWLRAAREGTPLALLLGDVDHFKRYNDTYGHQPGDRCLAAVAGALQAHTGRSSDLVARYGGEEFAILLPNTDLAGAAAVGERLRAAVAALAIPHSTSSAGPIVSVSLGAASAMPNGGGVEAALIAAADGALYRAKESGRNRVASAE